MQSLGQLLHEIENEAKRGIVIDGDVYEKAGRIPVTPILFAGNLDAKVAFLGRDLGRDEVMSGEPLVGGAGRKVRLGVCRHIFGDDYLSDREALRSALEHILLTNIVPYKPQRNKAYPSAIRERFRPYVSRFLVLHWHGNCIVTLGNEAFQWFAPYAEPGAAAEFWKREDKYEESFECNLVCDSNVEISRKPVRVLPLPHPSPLNRKYMTLFPALLEKRLASAKLT